MPTIDKKELNNALSAVKSSVGKSDYRQEDHLVFQKGRVFAYNGEVVISAPLPDGLQDFTCAVPASECLAIINKMKGDKLDISMEEGKLLFKSGRSKSGLVYQDIITMPIDFENNFVGIHATDISPTFCVSLQRAASCAADNNAQDPYTAVLLRDGYMVSTDGYRIYRAKLEQEYTTTLIPSSAVKSLTSIRPNKITISPTGLKFQNENNVICFVQTLAELQKYIDLYPQIDDHFNLQGVEVKIPANLESVLDATGIFVNVNDNTDRIVKFTLQNNEMLIHGEGYKGFYQETIDCEYSGEQVEFSVQLSSLILFLKQSLTVNITQSTACFNGDNFEYLCVLSKRN